MTMGFIQDDEDDKNDDNGKEDEGMAHEDPTADIDDIDFCLELLHSDVINVAYILELIEDLNPASDDYQMKRQNIIDTMIKDPAMRNKAKLIDHFIRDNVDNDQAGFVKSKADGKMDLESRLTTYVTQARAHAVTSLATEVGVSQDALIKYVQEYDYLHREKPEILQKAIKEKKGLRFLQRIHLKESLILKLRKIIETFSWE